MGSIPNSSAPSLNNITIDEISMIVAEIYLAISASLELIVNRNQSKVENTTKK